MQVRRTGRTGQLVLVALTLAAARVAGQEAAHAVGTLYDPWSLAGLDSIDVGALLIGEHVDGVEQGELQQLMRSELRKLGLPFGTPSGPTAALHRPNLRFRVLAVLIEETNGIALRTDCELQQLAMTANAGSLKAGGAASTWSGGTNGISYFGPRLSSAIPQHLRDEARECAATFADAWSSRFQPVVRTSTAGSLGERPTVAAPTAAPKVLRDLDLAPARVSVTDRSPASTEPSMAHVEILARTKIPAEVMAVARLAAVKAEPSPPIDPLSPTSLLVREDSASELAAQLDDIVYEWLTHLSEGEFDDASAMTAGFTPTRSGALDQEWSQVQRSRQLESMQILGIRDVEDYFLIRATCRFDDSRSTVVSITMNKARQIVGWREVR